MFLRLDSPLKCPTSAKRTLQASVRGDWRRLGRVEEKRGMYMQMRKRRGGWVEIELADLCTCFRKEFDGCWICWRASNCTGTRGSRLVWRPVHPLTSYRAPRWIEKPLFKNGESRSTLFRHLREPLWQLQSEWMQSWAYVYACPTFDTNVVNGRESSRSFIIQQ